MVCNLNFEEILKFLLTVFVCFVDMVLIKLHVPLSWESLQEYIHVLCTYMYMYMCICYIYTCTYMYVYLGSVYTV